MRYAITDEKGYMEMCLTNLDGLYDLIKDDFKDVAFPFDNFNVYGGSVKADDGKHVLYIICSIREKGKAPLLFMMYIGNERKLRAYIPKKGNNLRWEDGKIHSAEIGDTVIDMKRLEKEFFKHVIFINHTPDVGCANVGAKEIGEYSDRYGSELFSYIKRYTDNCMVYGLMEEDVKGITLRNDMGKSELAYRWAEIELKNEKLRNVFGIVYVGVEGNLALYIPIQGNTIDRNNRKVFNKDIEKVYVSQHKMLEEFNHVVSVSNDCLFDDLLTDDLMKLNGVPYEEFSGERTLGLKGMKKNFMDLEEEQFDFHEIYEEAVEERFGDMDYKISAEGKIDFRDVWIREAEVKFEGYLPIVVHCYYNVDGELKSYIPAYHNNLYKGELIPEGYKTPYIDLGRAGIGDIERYIEEIQLKEVRNARPYGFMVLDKAMKDMGEVAEKFGIENPKKLYQHKNGLLECYIMEHGNGMTAIYADIMGKLKTFDIDNVEEADKYILVNDIEDDEDLLL